MKPTAYEFIPWTAMSPAQPVVASGPLEWDEILREETLQIGGVVTEFFSTEAARREAERMLGACRERLRRGNRYAIIELLDDNPAFILVEWVRKALLRLMQGGLPLRRRGRIRGKYVVHPLIVAALVDALVDRHEVPNREEAFQYLAEKGLASYHTVKDHYYRRRQDSRFRAIYVEHPERAFRVPAAVAEPFIASVRMLEPGGAMRYMDPAGDLDLTFRSL